MECMDLALFRIPKLKPLTDKFVAGSGKPVVDSPHCAIYVPRGFVLRSGTQVLPGRRFFAFG